MKTKIFVIVLLAAALVSFTLVKSNKTSVARDNASLTTDRSMSDKDQFN